MKRPLFQLKSLSGEKGDALPKIGKKLTTVVTKETNNVTMEIDGRSDSDKVSSGFSARGG